MEILGRYQSKKYWTIIIIIIIRIIIKSVQYINEIYIYEVITNLQANCKRFAKSISGVCIFVKARSGISNTKWGKKIGRYCNSNYCLFQLLLLNWIISFYINMNLCILFNHTICQSHLSTDHIITMWCVFNSIINMIKYYFLPEFYWIILN